MSAFHPFGRVSFRPIADISFYVITLCKLVRMASGRKIVETAARMSMADLSVVLSALQQPLEEETRLTTVAGSDNHVLWSLMAEKGFLTDRGNPHPDLPIPMKSYSIVAEQAHWVHAVAVVCYEGVRLGMTPEEIIAHGEGKPDPRLAHL